MASALVDYARWKSVEPKPDNVSEFQIHAGEGIHGQIDGCNIYIGNKRIATRAGCPTGKILTMNNVEEGVTVGYVFCNAAPIGIFTLSDTCRTGTAEAIRELKSLGVKTAMLTGDSIGAATNAQNQVSNLQNTCIHICILCHFYTANGVELLIVSTVRECNRNDLCRTAARGQSTNSWRT